MLNSNLGYNNINFSIKGNSMGLIFKAYCTKCEYSKNELYIGSGVNGDSDPFYHSEDDNEMECFFPYHCKTCEDIVVEDVRNNKNIFCSQCNEKDLEPYFFAKINYPVSHPCEKLSYIDRIKSLFSNKHSEKFEIEEKLFFDITRKIIEYVYDKYQFPPAELNDTNTFSWSLTDKRADIKLYVNDTGLCPKCKTNYLKFENVGFWD